MIGVVATLKIQEGKHAEFEAKFAEAKVLVDAKEDGNLLYELFKSRDEKSTYIIMEKYVDDAAVAAHRNADHTKAIFAAMAPLLAGAPTVEILDAV